MNWYLHRDKVWASFCILGMLSLWIYASNEDYKAAVVSEKMTYEQLEQVAKSYATVIVTCANGGDIRVGDVYVDCEPVTITGEK